MSNLPPYIRSQYGIVAAGPTGTGKTVVFNAIHSVVPRISLFFNSQWKDYIRGHTVKYRGEEDNARIAELIDEGVTRIDVRPQSVDPEEEHEALTNALFELAKSGYELACWNDEVHEYGSTKGSSVHKLHKRGRDPGSGKGGIKVGSISQRYASHETSCRSEAMYFLQVGRPSTQDRDLLEEERFDEPDGAEFDALRDRNTQDKFKMRGDEGEVIARGFSVSKNGEFIYGPSVAAEKYAE